MNKQTLEQVASALFFVWIALLLPWLVLAPLAAMAFDFGAKFAVYVFIGSIWTYPVSVGVAWKLQQFNPLIALLPCINIVVSLVSGFSA